MTTNLTQTVRHEKHPTYVVHMTPRNFGRFRFIISRFLFNILRFPIDSRIKMSKCHRIFEIWSIVTKHNSLHSPWQAIPW